MLVIRDMDAPGVRGSCPLLDADRQVLCYRDAIVNRDGGVARMIADLLIARGVRCIGIDQDETSANDILAFREHGVVVKNVTKVVRGITAIKSERELNFVRAAARAADEALLAAVNAAGIGVPCSAMAAAALAAQAQSGTMPPIPPLIQVNEAAAHATWNAKPLCGGDVIRVELCGSVECYCSPVARTIAINHPSPVLSALHTVYKQGLLKAIGTIRAGVRANEVYDAFAAVLARFGLVKRSRLGYSFGLGVVRDWGEKVISIAPSDNSILKANMTLHLVVGCGERFVDTPGIFINLSETLIVTSEGVELLSRVPRDILVVEGNEKARSSSCALGIDTFAAVYTNFTKKLQLPEAGVQHWQPRHHDLPSGRLHELPQRSDLYDFHHSIGFDKTPLIKFDEGARQLNIGSLYVKDESKRKFGSFKGLGVSWVIKQLLEQPHVGLRHVCAASDGNHGLSLAHVARERGLECTIFLPRAVPQKAVNLLAAAGATVKRLGASYEDAVMQCQAWAKQHNVQMISDQSSESYTELPATIQQGYGTLFWEIEDSLDGAALDAVVIQAGVGGLAAAACTWLKETRRDAHLVLVEAHDAACFAATMANGGDGLITVPGEASSAYQGINCERASTVAWEILRQRPLTALSVDDGWAVLATACLSRGGIDTSATGAAGLAGVMAWQAQSHAALTASSRVLIINSEGSHFQQ